MEIASKYNPAEELFLCKKYFNRNILVLSFTFLYFYVFVSMCLFMCEYTCVHIMVYE